MVWAGAGVLWTVSGGIPRSRVLDGAQAATPHVDQADFSFVQISDSHIGFAKPPNLDTPGTLTQAVALVGQLKVNASLLIHTGDVSHLSKPVQFDTAEKIVSTGGLEPHYVPALPPVWPCCR